MNHASSWWSRGCAFIEIWKSSHLKSLNIITEVRVSNGHCGPRLGEQPEGCPIPVGAGDHLLGSTVPLVCDQLAYISASKPLGYRGPSLAVQPSRATKVKEVLALNRRGHFSSARK